MEDLFRLQRCAMFFILRGKNETVKKALQNAKTYTEFIVFKNKTSSSLYIVITMKSSVCRPYMYGRKVNFDSSSVQARGINVSTYAIAEKVIGVASGS